MLVISRRVGEVVRINNDITVQVLKIDRGVIRLGIKAPKEMKILREELCTTPEEAREAL